MPTLIPFNRTCPDGKHYLQREHGGDWNCVNPGCSYVKEFTGESNPLYAQVIICGECGGDLVCEGYVFCSECLELTTVDRKAEERLLALQILEAILVAQLQTGVETEEVPA